MAQHRTQDSIDILKAIIATCTPTVLITSSIDNLDGTFTLSTLNTYWLTSNKKITINLIDYRILSFLINESIIIEPERAGDPIPSVISFQMPAPFFLHGNIKAASIKQIEEPAPNRRLPFVWVQEILQEKNTMDDPLAKWGRSSSPRIYFMDGSETDYNDVQHKTNIVEPMRQMVELFFSKIKAEEGNLYGRVPIWDEIARHDWGQYVIDNGNTGKFFDDTLTGLQVGFDFQMSKTACSLIADELVCNMTVIVTVEPESTAGANDGTATAVVSGAIHPVTYLWNDPEAQTTAEAIDLAPGTYEVTVTDDVLLLCTAVDDGTVNAGVIDNINTLFFDRVTDYGVLDTGIVLSGEFFVAFELRRDEILADITIWTSTNAYALQMLEDDEVMIVLSGSAYIYSVPSIVVDEFTKIFITRDSFDDIRLYWNGVESTTGAQNDTKSCRIHQISGLAGGGSRKIGGHLDNFSVADRCPTPTELTQVTANPLNFSYVMGANTKVSLKMDESGDAPKALDSSAEGNDLTLVGYVNGDRRFDVRSAL